MSAAPPAESLAGDGGTSSIAVAATADCSWTASSASEWITSLSPASGRGPATVTFSATANPTPAMRVGAIVIEGSRITVQQQPGKCSVVIAPRSLTIDASGRVDVIAVESSAECNWSASTTASWIELSDATGTGNGAVKYRVAANAGAARNATITIADQSVSVSQSAPGATPAPPPCTMAVSPQQVSAAAAGGSFEIVVATAVGCAWATTSGASWVTPSRNGGSGNATVVLQVAANAGAARTTVVSVAGVDVSVSQVAAGSAPPPPPPACSFALAPPTQSIAAAGGTATPLSVTAGGSCAWTATSSVAWIVITAGASGTGNGSVALSIAANTGAMRTGTVTVAGQVATIEQAAAPPPPPTCSFAINPTTANVAAGASSTAVTVTATTGCAWTATANDPWIGITAGTSGSGDGSVTLSFAANTGAIRTGTVTIAGRTATFTQAAAAPTCTFAVSPPSAIAPIAASSTTFTVTAESGCGWTATSQANWLTVTAGATGTANGSVAVAVAENTGAPRTGTLTIAGNTVSVAQNGVCSSSTVSPLSIDAENTVVTGTITVAAASGCVWAATSNSPWITIVTGSSGAGDGTVTYQIAANTAGARNGSMTVAGQTVAVRQAKK